MENDNLISKLIKWAKDSSKSNMADMDFEIPNIKDENYSRLLLLKELRVDLLQLNDMINYHIKKSRLIKRDKNDVYYRTVTVESTFLIFWDRTTNYQRKHLAKLTLKDLDEKSKFFFRINDFRDTSHKGLSLDISFYPKDKDQHSLYDKDNIDIYEFEAIFSKWINNLILFNNFKIDKLSNEELIDSDLFFSTNNAKEDRLNDNEIVQLQVFLDHLKKEIESKKNSSNNSQAEKLILEIDYIKSKLSIFSKKKLKFYLNVLGKKIYWFMKEITLELMKEIIKRSLLGPG